MRSTILFVTSTLVLAAAPAAQITRLPAVADNTIYSEDGNLSNGANQLILCGSTGSGFVRRGLIRFDVSSIPSDAVILDVDVELSLDRTPLTTGQVELHRVTAAWGEAGSNSGNMGPGQGAGLGAPAQTGDATWTMRMFPSTAWTTPGGDFVPTFSATASLPVATGRIDWNDPMLTADVQAWVSGTQPNHGWIVRGDETVAFTGIGFRSREFNVATERPELIVTWSRAAMETTIGMGCSGASGGPLVLSSSGPPVVPTPNYTLSLLGGPANAARAYFAFGALSPAPLPLPSGCNVWGDPATLLATAVQQTSLMISIPNAPALLGSELTFQGLAVELSTGRLVTSNALLLRLGT